jgi:GT2 family glycosyltransferase
MPIRSIDIVIPLYYSQPSLFPIIQNCLDSLQNAPEHRLILVDDSSPLPTAQWSPTVTLEVNSGYTAAVNAGLERSTADIVIVMNDDITLKPHQLDKFLTLDDFVIASPMDTSGSADERFGACFGMTRATLEKMGYLDSRYKHFFSDLAYYRRAKELGVKIVKWTSVILDHPESSTYKTLDKEALYQEDFQTYIDS